MLCDTAEIPFPLTSLMLCLSLLRNNHYSIVGVYPSHLCSGILLLCKVKYYSFVFKNLPSVMSLLYPSIFINTDFLHFTCPIATILCICFYYPLPSLIFGLLFIFYISNAAMLQAYFFGPSFLVLCETFSGILIILGWSGVGWGFRN